LKLYQLVWVYTVIMATVALSSRAAHVYSSTFGCLWKYKVLKILKRMEHLFLSGAKMKHNSVLKYFELSRLLFLKFLFLPDLISTHNLWRKWLKHASIIM